MRNKWAKIMAIFALVWIVISVIWTWILYVVESNRVENTEINAEELQKLIEQMKTNSWETLSWETNSWETLTWEVNKK